MAADPKPSLSPTPNPAESLPTEIQQVLASGLGDFSLRELLSMLVSRVGLSERQAYLERVAHDKPSGFYDRTLQLGTIPLELQLRLHAHWGFPSRLLAGSLSARLSRRNPGSVARPARSTPPRMLCRKWAPPPPSRNWNA